jgi:hypothetical protein
MGSLLDGGFELGDLAKYAWLVKSTKESKLTPEAVDKLVAGLEIEDTKMSGRERLLRRFSFQIVAQEKKPTAAAIEPSIRSLSGRSDECDGLTNFENSLFFTKR